ncbi:uncharacterized protein LOC111601321 [Drosophila hydei]|uniref:Uncharacterized protein LOC111601321 n=1 Tax=Drosophila hydei TaxID=7224 RepID=A0A6J1LYY2_DROHY|nr:uncharacterized protein LOC111601321 [Drosophila hydei]
MKNLQIQAQSSINNSATSSENSETQSVEDHQSGVPPINRSAARIRAKTSWKRMKDLAAEKEKENEAKRPPWRAVSVSTLPKPDKNALLRAKLLDASRRLRAGKTNVALQTDFVPVKLMKEATTSAQDDLILLKSVGILTDGQYSIRKDGYQQYVLTYSVSQMTDYIDKADVSTQTLLPKVFPRSVSNPCLLKFLNHDKDDNYESNQKQPYKTNNVQLSSTLASWRFDDDAIEMEVKQHFIPYTIEALKPWRSFMPIPFYLRGNSMVGRQKVDWYFLLQSIDELIRESNNLLDRIQKIIESKNIQYQRVHNTLDEIRKFHPSEFIFPSEYWLPIIEKQEVELQILLDAK